MTSHLPILQIYKHASELPARKPVNAADLLIKRYMANSYLNYYLIF